MLDSVLLDGDDGTDPGAVFARLGRSRPDGSRDVAGRLSHGPSRVLVDSFGQHVVDRVKLDLVDLVRGQVAAAAVLARLKCGGLRVASFGPLLDLVEV